MLSKRSNVKIGCLVLSLLGASAFAQSQKPVMATPLVVVGQSDDGLMAHLELDFDAYDKFAAVQSAFVLDYALTPTLRVDLDVRRLEPLAPGAMVVRGTAQGDVPMAAPDLVVLAGTIAGRPDSSVFLGMSPHFVNGYAQVDGHTYMISSGPYGQGLPIAAFDMSELPEDAIQWVDAPECGTDLLRPREKELGSLEPGPVNPRANACWTTQIAVDSDWELTNNRFGGNAEASAAYVALLVTSLSDIGIRSGGAEVQASYIRVWDSNVDPWTSDDAFVLLDNFRIHWTNNMGHVERDTAHLVSARSLAGAGGVAWVNVTCSYSYGYALSGHLGGSFPYPLEDHHASNWDPFVFAHETGHNYGAPHTHDFNPPIDGCGLGDCSNRFYGTVMSYCHVCNGGMRNISMLYHERVIDEAIAPTFRRADCVDIAPDPNITQEPEDVQVCAGQGFELSAVVEGVEPLELQWYLNFQPIPGATEATYAVESATEADAGTYLLSVIDPCGGNTGSRSVAVTIDPGCPADFNGDCTQDTTDFLAYLNAFSAGDIAADFNGDGTVNSLDFLAFLNAFNEGCP